MDVETSSFDVGTYAFGSGAGNSHIRFDNHEGIMAHAPGDHIMIANNAKCLT